MKTRRQVWWREEKSRGKDERIVWPAPQMMLVTRLIHIYRIFLYTTFQSGVAVWLQWTRSRRDRGDFTIQCRWPQDPYRCYSGFWTSYPPPPSKSASEYEPPPSPSNFPLSGVCIIFFNWYHFFWGGGGINPRRIVFPPDKWVAWLAKLFCQSHKSPKTSPLPRSLGKDPSEWWEWSLATLLSTL